MRKLKGKEAWLNHSLPGGTGEGLIKTVCAAALLVHLVDERRGRAGPDLAACLRSYSSVELRCASENCEYRADLRGRFSAPALDPPALQSSPSQGPRTPGLRRTQAGLSKSCRGAFRSPRPSPKSGQADGASEDSLHLDVQKLKEKKDMLDKEISQLISESQTVGLSCLCPQKEELGVTVSGSLPHSASLPADPIIHSVVKSLQAPLGYGGF
ncbi:DNA repair protein SWI5 homolog isoform X2 [Neophocaena asiaeorientalis asiaeorientalis]|uniref:DNA repair protein SWI5 homolog n=1 Tax=Neophocaena asiaeorientalis asiaeorientalis TaxID=1706337 RepID=A0A341CVU9_NEOAA|nr:DNA repair protein SWI5 homolog isoform X2 [Neophocaena asiaeorientalis asiaeorientalis]